VSRRVPNRKNPFVIASTFSGIHDFFASGTWHVILNLLLFFLVAFWLAVGYWVYKDAKRRIEDPVLIATAVAIGLVIPYLGALVDMLFRPPEYLEEVRERELEITATEERLARRDVYCPVCRAAVTTDVLVSPGWPARSVRESNAEASRSAPASSSTWIARSARRTTRSIARSRSSGSWSSSSPQARPSPSWSRARRRSPHCGRRSARRIRRTPNRARSGAISPSRCPTTSCTGPIRRNRRSERSHSGSRAMSSSELPDHALRNREVWTGYAAEYAEWAPRAWGQEAITWGIW